MDLRVCITDFNREKQKPLGRKGKEMRKKRNGKRGKKLSRKVKSIKREEGNRRKCLRGN